MKLAFVLPLALLVGCGKKDEGPPPAAFTGPLTVDRIMASKDVVKVFDPWDKALPKIEAKLGKAQKVDAEKGEYTWAAMDGDKCAYVVFSSGDGKEFGKEGVIVDMIQAPMTVEKDGPLGNRKDCLEAAGKEESKQDEPPTPTEPGEGTGAGTGEGTGEGTAN